MYYVQREFIIFHIQPLFQPQKSLFPISLWFQCLLCHLGQKLKVTINSFYIFLLQSVGCYTIFILLPKYLLHLYCHHSKSMPPLNYGFLNKLSAFTLPLFYSLSTMLPEWLPILHLPYIQSGQLSTRSFSEKDSGSSLPPWLLHSLPHTIYTNNINLHYLYFPQHASLCPTDHHFYLERQSKQKSFWNTFGIILEIALWSLSILCFPQNKTYPQKKP